MILLTFTSLITLSSARVLLLVASRGEAGHYAYNPSFAILLTELIKLVGTFSLRTWLRWAEPDAPRDSVEGGFVASWLPYSLPSLCYTASVNLEFYALETLDAPTSQVLASLRVIYTAAMAHFFLGRALNWRQALGVVVIVAGVAVSEGMKGLQVARDPNHNPVEGFSVLGCVAMMAAGVISALAGAIITRLLARDLEVSIHERNLKLYMFGVLFNLISSVAREGRGLWDKGPFHGFDAMVWLIVVIGAASGILISVALRHSGLLQEVFASVITTCIVGAFSFLFEGFKVTWQWVAGVATIAVGFFVYYVIGKRNEAERYEPVVDHDESILELCEELEFEDFESHHASDQKFIDKILNE